MTLLNARTAPGMSLNPHTFCPITAPRPAEVTQLLEQSLSDYGFDVTPASDRLASFHRVENTYLSTFQTLGSLGLILGTTGLAAVTLPVIVAFLTVALR